MNRYSLFTALVIVGFGVQAAQADTWSRTGPHMQVDRSFDQEGSATVNRELQNGATATRSTSCDGTQLATGCASTIDLETQNDSAYTVERNAVAGPFRGRSITSVTGPEGDTIVSPNRWRRW